MMPIMTGESTAVLRLGSLPCCSISTTWCFLSSCAYFSLIVFMLWFYWYSMQPPRTGGETSFPKGDHGRGFKVLPKKLTAVLFYNLLEDGNGKLNSMLFPSECFTCLFSGDDLSLHSSMPVVKGNKWLANFWVWDPQRIG